MEEFIFGAFVYQYKLIKQQRKTLCLTVTPDLCIVLKCPEMMEKEKIEKFLSRKWHWLEKQLKFFRKYKRIEYAKEYISGESLYYLGRQYQLLVRKGDERTISLQKGKFILTTNDVLNNGKVNQQIIEQWMREKMNHVFNERLDEVFSRFNYKVCPKIHVKKMKCRWGSYMKTNLIILNSKLIQAPKECIDYVITHELCHFKYKEHSKSFYRLLSEKFPDWEQVKEKLELRFL